MCSKCVVAREHSQCIRILFIITAYLSIVNCLLQIEEVSDSNVTNTDDGAHYYDELPCNMKKDAHTGENAYQGEDVRCIHKTFK